MERRTIGILLIIFGGIVTCLSLLADFFGLGDDGIGRTQLMGASIGIIFVFGGLNVYINQLQQDSGSRSRIYKLYNGWKNNLNRYLVSQRTMRLFYWFNVIFLSSVVFSISKKIHKNMKQLANAEIEVLSGNPPWISFQNRLLGPYIVNFVSQLGFSFQDSLLIFHFFMILIEIIILYSLFLHLSKYQYKLSLQYVLYFSFIFIAMQSYWSYSWDYIDLIVFTLFAWGIFRRKSLIYFVLLFFVELFNREACLFISLYIIIDSIDISSHGENFLATLRSIKLNFKKMIVGIILTVIGMSYIRFSRELLFIKSSLDRGNGIINNASYGNDFKLFDNINKLVFENILNVHMVTSIFVIYFALFLILKIPRLLRINYKALLITGAIFLSILIFGAINETRMYIILIPFLIFFHWELNVPIIPANNQHET